MLFKQTTIAAIDPHPGATADLCDDAAMRDHRRGPTDWYDLCVATELRRSSSFQQILAFCLSGSAVIDIVALAPVFKPAKCKASY